MENPSGYRTLNKEYLTGLCILIYSLQKAWRRAGIEVGSKWNRTRIEGVDPCVFLSFVCSESVEEQNFRMLKMKKEITFIQWTTYLVRRFYARPILVFFFETIATITQRQLLTCGQLLQSI